MRMDDVRIIQFPKIEDHRGNLSFIEGGKHIPFEIKRVYYLYDIPGGAERGGHAHRQIKEIIIAINGSFDVVLDDGVNRNRYHMNRSFYGLYLPEMMWRTLDNFSSGSVCMVLASHAYDESDYIRDYKQFQEKVSIR
jgi:hypothetical protein